MGVGEGWRFVGVLTAGLAAFNGGGGTALNYSRAQPQRRGRPPEPLLPPDVVDPAALDAAGFDVCVNGYGRVFVRDPSVASVFQPKRPAAAQGAQS